MSSTMKLEEARAIALAQLRQNEAAIDRPLSLVEASTQEFADGWIFYWNTTRYLQTGDHYDALIGQGPLIVLGSGAVLEGGSRDRPEEVLNRHGLAGRPHFTATVEWAPWKGAKHTPGGSEYRAWAKVSGRDERIPVTMKRTPEKGVWDIAFSLDPPHGDITFDSEAQIFEGARQAGTAVLKGWISPSC